MSYIKKFLFGLFLFLIFQTSVLGISFDLYSKNAILYNLNDDEVLYENNSDTKTSIASLTKIMTAIVVLENVDNLDKQVVLKRQDFNGLVEENAAVAGFQVGEKVTYRDLLYGLLLPSGADAAQALVRLVSKNQQSFVALMNQKASEIGLKNTHFANPIGFDDKNNYSTVKEVAFLFKYAWKKENFRKIIEASTYQTSNKRLKLRSTVSKYKGSVPYIKGGKTGTTDGAGLCLASVATLRDANLMLVTTGAPYDKKGPHHLEDAKTVYDYFKDNYSYQKLVSKEDVVLELKTKYVKKENITFTYGEDILKYLPNNYNQKDISFKYHGIEIINYNLKRGKVLGTLEVYYQNQKIGEKIIILKEDMKLDVVKYIKENMKWIIGSLILIIITVLGMIKIHHKKGIL